MIGLMLPSLVSALAGLQAGAKARGVEQTGAHLQNMDALIGVTVMGGFRPINAAVKPCAYCGVDDFAHNQCQRCGATR